MQFIPSATANGKDMVHVSFRLAPVRQCYQRIVYPLQIFFRDLDSPGVVSIEMTQLYIQHSRLNFIQTGVPANIFEYIFAG